MLIGEKIIQLNGEDIVVAVRRSTRAKYMRVQYTTRDGVTLILPERKSLKAGLLFLESSQGWLLKRAHKLSTRNFLGVSQAYFKHEERLSVFGQQYQAIHKVSDGRNVRRDKDILLVECRTEEFHSMIVKWLQAQSHLYFNQQSQIYARKLEVNFNNVRIKNLKSRWGSCSSSGNLSYSWHLSLAPLQVAEYLCAHEVSHLREMNHSKKFWHLVQSLCAHYKDARKWLKEEGPHLLRYPPL